MLLGRPASMARVVRLQHAPVAQVEGWSHPAFSTVFSESLWHGHCVLVQLPQGEHVGDDYRLPDEVRLDLHARELAHMRDNRPARSVSFAGGRLALRRALWAVEAPGFEPILPGKNGAPMIPAQFTGSISHTHGLAAALVSRCPPDDEQRTAVGIDVERTSRPTSLRLARRPSPSVSPSVSRPVTVVLPAGGATPTRVLGLRGVRWPLPPRTLAPHLTQARRILAAEEQRQLGVCDFGLSMQQDLTLRFSLKEALYKARLTCTARALRARGVRVACARRVHGGMCMCTPCARYAMCTPCAWYGMCKMCARYGMCTVCAFALWLLPGAPPVDRTAHSMALGVRQPPPVQPCQNPAVLAAAVAGRLAAYGSWPLTPCARQPSWLWSRATAAWAAQCRHGASP